MRRAGGGDDARTRLRATWADGGGVVTPHEETWTVLAEWGDPKTKERGGPWHVVNEKRMSVGTFGDGCANPDRAKLAAQAPAMARLLLSLHRHTGDGEATCVHCCRWSGHAPDCALVAVLRAAGVVE